MLVFDIETAPQPEDELRKKLPPLDESEFEVGEFDANQVKLGNAKKPETIEKKIEEARAAHAKRKAMQDEILAKARKEHWERFRDAAPLNAAYGKVLCIGVYSVPKEKFKVDWCEHDESSMIARFWSLCTNLIHANRSIVGVNIHEFDLPFMVRRSWILGVDVPNIIGRDFFSKWPKWHERFIDLRRLWLLGCFPGNEKSSFETLAHAFGTPGKRGESGAEFWKLWNDDSNCIRAMRYLEQDVRQPAEWAQRMGVR